MRRVLVLAGLAVLLGCGGAEEGAVADPGFKKLESDQVLTGFEQYVTENGRRKAVLRGDTAFIYEDSSLAKVRKVDLILYDEQGAVSATLKSKAGRLNTYTQEMVATGNVVLITAKDGSQIETEELHYDPNTHRVWSTVATTQRRGDAVITGTGFEADDKFYNVRVSGARSSGGGFRISF